MSLVGLKMCIRDRFRTPIRLAQVVQTKSMGTAGAACREKQQVKTAIQIETPRE